MAQHARAVADRLEFSARTAKPVPLFLRETAKKDDGLDDVDDADPVTTDRMAPAARTADDLLLVGL
jgi:3-carboxy-cis,cis-muconate cycloisomerase